MAWKVFIQIYDCYQIIFYMYLCRNASPIPNAPLFSFSSQHAMIRAAHIPQTPIMQRLVTSLCQIRSVYTIPYTLFAMKKQDTPKKNSPAVTMLHRGQPWHIQGSGWEIFLLDQNQYRLSTSWPGTSTFMPHMPVMMFIGRTIVPKTVSLPNTSAVCSCRSFIRMLI